MPEGALASLQKRLDLNSYEVIGCGESFTAIMRHANGSECQRSTYEARYLIDEALRELSSNSSDQQIRAEATKLARTYAHADGLSWMFGCHISLTSPSSPSISKRHDL